MRYSGGGGGAWRKLAKCRNTPATAGRRGRAGEPFGLITITLPTELVAKAVAASVAAGREDPLPPRQRSLELSVLEAGQRLAG